MSDFLKRLQKTHRSKIFKGKFTSYQSWELFFQKHFKKFPASYREHVNFFADAKRDLAQAFLEFNSKSFGIKSIQWTRSDLSQDINFLITGTDDAIIPVKVMIGVSDKAILTRNGANLSSFTAMSVLHCGTDCKRKNGLIIVSDGKFHESVFTDWAPAKTGSVRFVSKEELNETFENKKFWNFYIKRAKSFRTEKFHTDPIILENWQEDAEVACNSPVKTGSIFIGTGGGKTVVFSTFLARRIREATKPNIYVIVTPSLLLTEQTLRTVFKSIINDHECPSKYLMICSSDADKRELEDIASANDMPTGKICTTTSTREIQNVIDDAEKKNLPLVITVTYRSLGKLSETLLECKKKIEILIFDEAHNLIKGKLCGWDNRDEAIKLESIAERVRYFTATPSKSFDGRRGFHEEKYQCLYSISNRELILKGCIVPLKMVTVDVTRIVPKKDGGYWDLESPHVYPKIVKAVFEKHRQICIEESKSPEKFAPRILVRMPNSTDLMTFAESKENKSLFENGVQTYTIGSKDGLHVNGTKYVGGKDKAEYLRVQRELPSNIESLSAHIEMLVEGIDIQTFNGFLACKSITDAVLMNQSHGRTRRPDLSDKEFIRNNHPTWNELEYLRKNNGLIKPYAYVYVLSFIEDSEFYSDDVKKLLKRELSIMGDGIEDVEIYPIVEIACPEESRGGAPNAGDIVGDTSIPRDFSNIDKIGLRFTEVEIDNIKKEVVEDEQKRIEQEFIDEKLEQIRNDIRNEFDEILGEIG